MVKAMWTGLGRATLWDRIKLVVGIVALLILWPIERLLLLCGGRVIGQGGDASADAEPGQSQAGEAVSNESVDEILRRNPADHDARFKRVSKAMDDHEWEAALDDLDAAVQHGYDNPVILLSQARCYEWLDLHERALEHFEAYLEHNPDDGAAIYERGRMLSFLGDSEEAIECFDRAQSLGVEHATLFHCRAHEWRQLEEPEKAVADLMKGLEDSRGRLHNGAWYHSRATLFCELEQYLPACKDLGEAILLEPENALYYEARGNALLELDRDKEAESDFEKMEKLLLEANGMNDKIQIFPLVQQHFSEAPLEQLDVTIRKWPYRVAADLQRAFDRMDAAGIKVQTFYAIQQGNCAVGDFTEVYVRNRRTPVIAVPPRYLEIDIGEDVPVRGLMNGMWLVHVGKTPLCVLLNPDHTYLFVQVAAPKGPEGLAATNQFFAHLSGTIERSECYRGKVLSLEQREMYSGEGIGLSVHKLRKVERRDLILPVKTIETLERNVVQFIAQRPRLAALGMSVKKGLLLHGPPGTGKTHTIHYLARSLADHTTFLISAEQVGDLSEYMSLARLMQPSMIVIEDVDLIARDRNMMRSTGEEVLLNKLLNEMDGLRADAQILFILTTNRPEALEDALASRPGRIDQAIEIPLPDADGRGRLVRLYANGVTLAEGVVPYAVQHSDRVSASFIKELMRRSVQFALVDSGEAAPCVKTSHIQSALDELLVHGGPLNRKVLGAAGRDLHFAR